MTVLEPGEILTAVRIPATWAGANFYFEKIADRAAWDLCPGQRVGRIATRR